MKKIFYLSTLILTSLIVSCSNDDDPIPIPAPVIVAPLVVVPDTRAPTITLVGSSTINLEEGDSYTDAGASAQKAQQQLTSWLLKVIPHIAGKSLPWMLMGIKAIQVCILS